tara:strand:+ start:1684 stop:2655 length:972 start_codon:yes stop_codon:yes gene_type:complete
MKANIVDAINLCLQQEMEKDPSIVLIGEDVGVDGGVFRVTDGLLKKFGKSRVMDSPLAESGIVGTSIGMAIAGLKPVAEIQFEGFTLPALDQLISHASRMRNRTRGKFTVPLVVRSPFGGGINALEHHSDSPETYFCHTPGLKVVIPSTPFDAKGLLASAIHDPDPVIFFEPKKIYRAITQEIPTKRYTLPIGKAHIIKKGKDVTVVSYGALMKDVKKVSEESNYDLEIIDLRTLKPLDIDTILTSVRKTGKLVIVNEAPRTLSLASEISAQISEKGLLYLDAPVERVTGFDIIVPLPKLENHYRPSLAKIGQAIDKVMNFGV